MKLALTFGLIIFFVAQTFAQNDVTIQDYIQRYKKIAIEEMLEYGIPASITIAQGIHESSAGTSKLALNSNNHFGIKCHNDWEGKSYNHDDDKPQECFRVYNNAEESYRDHSKFLKNRKWYNPLFELKADDYRGWAHGLKKAGYATNPKYAYILIGLIDKYNLHDLDEVKKEDLVKMHIDTALFSSVSNAVKTDSVKIVQKTGTPTVCHEVKQGETLYTISKLYNTTVDSILKVNHLANYKLYAGQNLIISQ
ncbi:MAG TPA: glucosaminidase domain-containing protein [Chitinophagales bacterium]